MKKYIIFILSFVSMLLILATSQTFATHNNGGTCLGIYGNINVNGNWPGGSISVSCQGTSPSVNPNPQCPGDSQGGLGPGSYFDLGYCSCEGYGADGCLRVQGVPNGCTSSFTGGYCGANGQTIDASLQITCEPPPLNCPPYGTNCTGPDFCCGDNQWCQTCSTGEQNGECTQGPVEQGTCQPGDICDSSINQCVAPPQPPAQDICANGECRDVDGACGGPCGIGRRGVNRVCALNGEEKICGNTCRDDDSCTQDEAKSCSQTCYGQNQCASGLICWDGVCRNQSCTNDADCTCAVGGQNPPGQNPPGQNPPGQNPPGQNPPGQNPPGTQPTLRPTATPTPDFNPAMCKCDGIVNSALFAGEPVTVRAFAKVEGTDVTKALIKNMVIGLYKGANANQLIEKSSLLPADVIETTASKVRYKSDWKFTMPKNVQIGEVYQIRATVNCERKTAQTRSASSFSTLSEISPEPQIAPIENKSIIERLTSFVGRLFGKKEVTKSTSQPNIKPTAVPTINYQLFEDMPSVKTDEAQVLDDNLQLQPIYPARVEESACTYIKFKFEEMQRRAP